MIHEDYGFYSYSEHYVLGDVFVLTSPDKEKGTLLELKGKDCRQMESYLLAQHRSWFDFLMDALIEGGVMKRLDLGLNICKILCERHGGTLKIANSDKGGACVTAWIKIIDVDEK